MKLKNAAFHREVIAAVQKALREQKIDAYLILTSEGADPVTALIPGVDTVGAGAFVFTAAGQAYAFASRIDSGDIVDSGLFDRVVIYENYDTELAAFFKTLAPRRIALDFSEREPLCDGLTMGRWQRFCAAAGSAGWEEVSADTFLPQILRDHPIPEGRTEQ